MRVSMREFLGDIQALSERALTEPLSITADGEDSLVLLSAAEYERLKQRDRRALLTEDLSEEDIELIRGSEMPAAYDHLDAEITGWESGRP